MEKIKLAVLFGGASSEHEVSLVSAGSVLSHLSLEKYEIICIGITKSGKWLHYAGSFDQIPDGRWEKHPSNQEVWLRLNQKEPGLYLSKTGQLLQVDCAFPVLHGKNGEDGSIQGLFEMAGIPYVGCNIISSADCMDKSVTHILAEREGIKMARWHLIHKSELNSISSFADIVEKEFGFPVFVKPVNAGSSVGISKASSRQELLKGIELAFQHDDKVIVEETIVGKEIECAVLGTNSPEVSIPGEIVPCNEFYDYEAKYQADSKLIIPASIDKETTKAMQETAKKAFLALGCKGLARVDFFVNEQNQVILNEINTMPGFTSISMYPKLWDASGLPYEKLLEKLVDIALYPER